MNRWKVAAAAIVGTTAVAGLVVAGSAIKAQDRRGSEIPRARAFHLAQSSGSQIGVTVRDRDSGGVLVEDVRENSAAERAGVKAQDLIVQFDGERVRSARQFSRLVDETPQGRAVKMVVERGGQRTTLDVSPEPRSFGRIMPAPLERFNWPDADVRAMPYFRDFELALPDMEVFSSRAGRLGVQLDEVDGQLAEYFGVKHGALVTSVAENTPAARAGLKAGDVITKVNGEAVEAIGGVRRELRRIDPDVEFVVEIVRERKPMSLKVKLDPPRPGTNGHGTPTDAD